MHVELKLLATMLYRGDFSPLIRGDITEEHFQTDSGKVLYNFITTYRHETGGAAVFPSLSIVRNRFQKSSLALELPDPDPGDTVPALVHETTLEHFKSYVREASVELETVAGVSTDPLGEVLPIIAKLKKITERAKKSNHMSLANSLIDVVQSYHNGEIMPDGITWPWEAMTKATRGIQRKELVVIAGRPKSRKSFVAFSIASHVMKVHGSKVLIFSPEMPCRQVILRLVATLAGVRYSEFKDGAMDAAEEARLWELAERYGMLDGEDEEGYSFRLSRELGLPEGMPFPSIDVLQSTGRDVGWLESQIELYQPDTVIYDSFYRQHATTAKKGDGDWKAVQALSREVKDLTVTTNTRGIATHQLNRSAEKSIGDLSNLALADAVGQDADMVLRVITGKHEGRDRSALVVLGGREVPFDGILINNVPCCDFSEVGAITKKKQVEALMKQEEEADDDEDGAEGGKKAHPESRKAKEARMKKAGLQRVKQAIAAHAFKVIDEPGEEGDLEPESGEQENEEPGLVYEDDEQGAA